MYFDLSTWERKITLLYYTQKMNSPTAAKNWQFRLYPRYHGRIQSTCVIISSHKHQSCNHLLLSTKWRIDKEFCLIGSSGGFSLEFSQNFCEWISRILVCFCADLNRQQSFLHQDSGDYMHWSICQPLHWWLVLSPLGSGALQECWWFAPAF